MNVLILGRLHSLELKNAVISFKNIGYDIVVVNTSRNYLPINIVEFNLNIPIINLYGNIKYRSSFIHRIRKFLILCGISRGGRLKYKLISIFKDYDIDFIYALWGTNALIEIKLIQNINNNVPIFYNYLTYPTREMNYKNTIVNYFLNKIILKIDGHILASHYMKEFMYKIHNINLNKAVIHPSFYSNNYKYKNKFIKISSLPTSSPNIIYIGTTKFEGRLIDDVRLSIANIAHQQINIYVPESKCKFPDSDYLHFYKKIDSIALARGELAAFMSKFDASIILYNFSIKAIPKERFKNSIPSRFFFSLISGLPILIEKDYLLSCEDFISRYKNGIIYNDFIDLNNKLKDISLINEIQINARSLSDMFTFENSYPDLEKFILSIISSTRR